MTHSNTNQAIRLNGLSFTYEGTANDVFRDLNLELNSAWKTGLIGANGHGKTTLLKLLTGELQATFGRLHAPLPFGLFPAPASNQAADANTLSVIRAAIAPFELWEARMNTLLETPDAPSLAEYDHLQESYENAGGYEIDEQIKAECAKLQLSEQLLERPFAQLSGGEQTRALILPLFLRKDNLPLLDEPTNHLDLAGRRILGDYLAAQSGGFILASHDRDLLDRCTNHTLALNLDGPELIAGPFHAWKTQFQERELEEQRKREKLLKENRRLEAAAREKRLWSGQREKDKIGALDKGFEGARAARLMKRALAVEKRIKDNLDENRKLLANHQKTRRLKTATGPAESGIFLRAQDVSARTGDRILYQNLSLEAKARDRIAILGPNGSGKTTLLHSLANVQKPQSGSIKRKPGLHTEYARQFPLWHSGLLSHHLQNSPIDEPRFRQVMAALGMSGNIFNQPLESFSQGQLKKIDLCRSFCNDFDLLFWDEPLNFLDIRAREALEDVLTDFPGALIFIEHDQRFVDTVATEVLML